MLLTSEILHWLSKQMRIFPIYSNSIQHAILFTHFEAFRVSDTPRSVLVIIPSLLDVLIVLWTCHVISVRALTMSHSYFLSKSNLFLVCSQRTKTQVISRVRKQKVRRNLVPGTSVTWSLDKQGRPHAEGYVGRDTCWLKAAVLSLRVSLIVA